jgi:hypothetical protein
VLRTPDGPHVLETVDLAEAASLSGRVVEPVLVPG